MTDQINKHHELETELYRLRLLRDLRDPEYSPEKEDAILDEMEAIWYRLTPEDRRVLEAERAVRDSLDMPVLAQAVELRAVDVDEDAHLRRCLPPRIAVGSR